MANEDLFEWGSDELAHLLVLCEGEIVMGNPQATERVEAIKQILLNRGLWYCHHDESLEPLENCTKCRRHYLYLETPDDPI